MKKLGSHSSSKQRLRIGLMVMTLVFMVSFGSAANFDNTKNIKDKTFDGKNIQGNSLLEKYKPIEIKNSFGFGSTLFEGYLSQHDEICGQDCKSTMEIKLNKDGVLIDDIMFKTLQEDNSWIEQDVRSYQFLVNGENYNVGDEVEKGTYEVELIAEKKPSRTVDWIVTTQGKEIGEWAIWGNISKGDDAEVILNSPADDYVSLFNEIIFNASSNITDGANITNMSLWTNETGTWGKKNETVFASYISENLNLTSGSTSLGGNLIYRNVYIGPEATLTCNSTGYLNIRALENITIEGSITCSGTGTGGSGGAGGGYNTGTYYCSQGGGGAGSGNSGGNGAYGLEYSGCDEIGIGGSENGNESNIEIYQNTKGGAGGRRLITGGGGVGGNGGYGIELKGNNVRINGTLTSNGVNGQGSVSCSDFTCSGGGGGAGGVIAVEGKNINLTDSNLNAEGGDGGDGTVETSTSSCWQAGGGGGGAGGRIKIIYEDSIDTSGISYSLAGGTGGTDEETTYCTGTWLKAYSPAGIGGTGTYYTAQSIVFENEIAEINYIRSYNSGDTILWNVQACDSDGDCGFATSNYTVYLDTTNPQIDIQTPTTTLDYNTIGQQEILNVTFTDTNIDTCWFDYNGTNVSIDRCTTGVSNSTNFTLEENNYNMTVWVNDSVGNINSEFLDWDYQVLEENRTHNSTSYETAYETYSINVTANSSLTAVSLNYNGTYYAATKSGTVWTYSMDIPSASIGNNSIGWKFTYAGNTINSDYTTYQNISAINLTYCTSGTPFINFTFKNEADDSTINATIPTSTLMYYLGNGDTSKTLTYINTDANYAYAFCFNAINETLNLDYMMQYQSEDYPQRTSEPDTFSITNETTDKTLYLLGTVDGIYVTFQVINTADQLISGVDVTATREIDGSDVVVGVGTTGASGSVTFWLNPDFLHDFSFSKDGYSTYEYSEYPTQTSYTITMSGTTTVSNSTFQGIERSITPTDTYLINDTDYTFAFNLTSSYWDVSDYGFVLRLANGTQIDGGSTGTEGTELTLVWNSSNQTVIYMDYYWVIDDVYTNRTTKWLIFNEENTGWSLSFFFTDLNVYLDSGIFGLDDFGRNLLVFLILFISIGIMSYKFGFTSPISITAMIFGVIYFLDVITKVMPDVGGMENLPTFIAALALVLVVINEVRLR